MSSTEQRILITGANGQLGAELSALEWSPGTSVIATSRAELDVADRRNVERVFEAAAPTVVINAAAYTAVDKAESEPEIAELINHRAVFHLAAAAASAKARFIHVSTDYVFDGATVGWYREGDQPNPLSVYGRSKLAGEQAALELADALVIRTSWLYSQRGSNFVKTIRTLGRSRSTLGVVADQRGCPTSARDLAKAIAGAIESGLASSGLFHVAAPDDASWFELADEVLRLDGTRDLIDLEALTTEQYPVDAVRPTDSRLSSEAFASAYDITLLPWRRALAEVQRDLERAEADDPSFVSAGRN